MAHEHWHFISLFLPPAAEQVVIGCDSDNECPLNLACRNRECIDPCHLENPCGDLATCITTSHRPTCQCPYGTTGNAYQECRPSKCCRSSQQCQFGHSFSLSPSTAYPPFQSSLVNASKTRTARTLSGAMRSNVKIHVALTGHAESMQSADPPATGLSANAGLASQELQSESALSVGCCPLSGMADSPV